MQSDEEEDFCLLNMRILLLMNVPSATTIRSSPFGFDPLIREYRQFFALIFYLLSCLELFILCPFSRDPLYYLNWHNWGIRLDKQKGQCYLIDQNLANFIIAEAELNPEIDTVLEIGPGLGTLSDFLAAKSRQLFLIEYDKKMVHFLAENFQLQYESVLINPDMRSIPSETVLSYIKGMPWRSHFLPS